MGFTHPVTGELCRWVVLPQGTKQSPSVFCAVSEAAARIFNRLFTEAGVKCFTVVYVDDYILIAESHSDLVKAFDIMDAEAPLLGLVFNLAKDIGKESPLTSIEALGLIIDSQAMTLGLPESKRSSYTQEITKFRSSFFQKACAPRKFLEELVGKLIFAAKVCRWGYLFVQEILDQLCPVGVYPPPRQVPLTEGVWHDLRFWAEALGDKYLTWMGIQQHLVGRKEVALNKDNFSVELFTDASGSLAAWEVCLASNNFLKDGSKTDPRPTLGLWNWRLSKYALSIGVKIYGARRSSYDLTMLRWWWQSTRALHVNQS